MKYNLALITGAGSGLGKELAFQLAQKKIPLFLSSKDPQKLDDLKKELETLTSVTILSADLSLKEERKKLLEKIRELKPDLIINNAGLGLYGEILSFPLEKQMGILAINVEALVEISIESARVLKKEQLKGTLLNISSAASFFIYPNFALYAASKNFVKDFSLSFDEELKPYGIRVFTSLLGRFQSEFKYKASGYTKKSVPSWDTMQLGKTAKSVISQIEKEKRYQIIDFRYQILCTLAKLFPRKWISKALKKNQ